MVGAGMLIFALTLTNSHDWKEYKLFSLGGKGVLISNNTKSEQIRIGIRISYSIISTQEQAKITN